MGLFGSGVIVDGASGDGVKKPPDGLVGVLGRGDGSEISLSEGMFNSFGSCLPEGASLFFVGTSASALFGTEA
jgi:hypothetical protein